MLSRLDFRPLALFAVLLFLSCGTPGAPAQSASRSGPPSVEYRLGAGDGLRVRVFGRDELSGDFSVNPQGHIAFPLLGEIEAAGLTVPEFSERLGDALRNGYVREPNISIEIATYRPFYILGEVQKPGAYPYSPGLTAVGAVATAGGFTYRANSRRIFIQHAGQSGERAYALTGSTIVQPGDTVRVPERLF